MAYANPQLLVESDWLEANLGNEGLRIIDIRSADDYAAGHVPNAINIRSADDYAAGHVRLLASEIPIMK